MVATQVSATTTIETGMPFPKSIPGRRVGVGNHRGRVVAVCSIGLVLILSAIQTPTNMLPLTLTPPFRRSSSVWTISSPQPAVSLPHRAAEPSSNDGL